MRYQGPEDDPTAIDIRGLDKAELLAALWNNTGLPGLPRFLRDAIEPMTADQAREIIAGHPELDFDYLNTRPMKLNISGDKLWPGLYDRDAGQGRAAQVVAELRARVGSKEAP